MTDEGQKVSALAVYEKSREKIDGIVALIMAIDLALRHPESKSVYEKRGICGLFERAERQRKEKRKSA